MYAWVYLTDFLYVKRLSEAFDDSVNSTPYHSYREFIKIMDKIASQRNVIFYIKKKLT